MRDTQIRWQHINEVQKGRRLFDTYCQLNGCCEECNRKVRFWCKVKERLIKHQEKIIKNVLDKRWRADNGNL